MIKTIKLRFTITWTIDTQAKWYEPGMTPEQMAVIEQNGDIPALLAIGLEQDDFTFTVAPEPAATGAGNPGKSPGEGEG